MIGQLDKIKVRQDHSLEEGWGLAIGAHSYTCIGIYIDLSSLPPIFQRPPSLNQPGRCSPILLTMPVDCLDSGQITFSGSGIDPRSELRIFPAPEAEHRIGNRANFAS
jgi:hypothetical protein